MVTGTDRLSVQQRLRRTARRIRNDGFRHLVKVCSHPRSGTHLMEAFIGENFYPGRDLAVAPVRWGHWSDLRVDEAGNPYGKLFGGHGLPKEHLLRNAKVVYIYRDGRAVAHSVWRTPNFLSEATKRELTFSEFLRAPLDWCCGPEIRATAPLTIAQHWHQHVDAWVSFAREHDNVVVVRFEELMKDPRTVRDQVRQRFFPRLREVPAVVTIDRPVGILPNEGSVDRWRDAFSAEDDAAFRAQLPYTEYLTLP